MQTSSPFHCSVYCRHTATSAKQILSHLWMRNRNVWIIFDFINRFRYEYCTYAQRVCNTFQTHLIRFFSVSNSRLNIDSTQKLQCKIVCLATRKKQNYDKHVAYQIQIIYKLIQLNVRNFVFFFVFILHLSLIHLNRYLKLKIQIRCHENPKLYDDVDADSVEYRTLKHMTKMWTNFVKYGCVRVISWSKIKFFICTQP